MPKGKDDNHGVSAYMGVSTNSRTQNGGKLGEQMKDIIKMSWKLV